MLTVLSLIGLVALFYGLGFCADLVVVNIRNIGRKLRLPIFFLGLLLGLLTSLPELAIGINALVQDIPSISVGNLLGGTLVLFCLVLGISILLNRKIKTDGKSESLFPMLGYILLPLILGLSGQINFWSGLVLLVLYPTVLLHLYLAHPNSSPTSDPGKGAKSVIKELAIVAAGLTGVVLLSNLIVRITQPLLISLNVPAFLVGLIIYSLGTNLPELIVAIRSWKRHIRELSLSNILGSAVTNPGMLGAFAIIRELPIKVDAAYIVLFITTLLVLICLLRFYRSDRALKRNEGIALIAIYLLFVVASGITTFFL